MALGVVVTLAILFESDAPSRRRRDHLWFELTAPRREVAAFVKAYLELNRISNSILKERSIFGRDREHSNIIRLGSWNARLMIGVDSGDRGDGPVQIMAGPVGPENEPQLRKLVSDLKRELEREFLSRAA